MSDPEETEYCKVLYIKTVSTEGLVKEDEHFIRLSRDNGKTWSRINKKDVRLTIPQHPR